MNIHHNSSAMTTAGADVHSKYVQALRTQNADPLLPNALPCPFVGHEGRIFQTLGQLCDHAKTEHAQEVQDLRPNQVREKMKNLILKQRKSGSSDATAGGGSAPDLATLSLDSDRPKERKSPPSSGKKRPAESDGHARRGKAPSHPEFADADFDRHSTHVVMTERTRRPDNARLFDPAKTPTFALSSPRSVTETSRDHVRHPNKKSQSQVTSPKSPSRQIISQAAIKSHHLQRQPGVLELQRYDPRYPSMLLQPDSRPISQEQLASEVKSIYAGLTMVETKCIHVDREQATAVQGNSDPNHKLASDHWQALIALHRTLLHEHHDFFLASQHPSASGALRRLAAKYSMPARMWKHGIHSFLELLRRRLPDSIDYMLAFIYLAYQMMALLYETVPAFEDTWIECLGDLGRYRMAIEDEDIRDRETWAGVARSWYTKAADKNPTVGRLYHHLAILARPNALQQLYYYSRSLTCVRPFPSARESILTLLDPILGRAPATYSNALPIDTAYIKAHALLFGQLSLDEFKEAATEFTSSLDNHIGRVTAKWKEQGVYIAVTNISGWFGYGVDKNALREVFRTQITPPDDTKPSHIIDEQLRTASPADQQQPPKPVIPPHELPAAVNALSSDPHFSSVKRLTTESFSLALRRIGDKNVLPHVHIMLSFLTTFAAESYVSHLLADMPWFELVAFLNTLIKTENQIQNQNQPQSVNQPGHIDTLLSNPIFPNDGERSDELPLPEDYLVRGLIWAHDYFPKKWFEREHDEEERYLELASTVKSRMERVLRLGYKLASHNRWISFDEKNYTFAVVNEINFS